MSKGITGLDGADYRPWQFTSFDPPRAASLPTAAELENIHQQARDEGYAAGRAEGQAAVRAEAASLQKLLTAAREDLARLDQEVADRVLALALEVARRVVGEAFRAKPELILPVVQDAVRCLPEFEQPVRVHLHPADTALVEAQLGDGVRAGGWQLVADGGVARGGCKLATATGAIDATLASRWDRVLAALGQSQAWLP